jgi:hypothetical protein
MVDGRDTVSSFLIQYNGQPLVPIDDWTLDVLSSRITFVTTLDGPGNEVVITLLIGTEPGQAPVTVDLAAAPTADSVVITNTAGTNAVIPVAELGSAGVVTSDERAAIPTALQPEDIAAGTVTPATGDVTLVGATGQVLTLQADGSVVPSTPAGGTAPNIDQYQIAGRLDAGLGAYTGLDPTALTTTVSPAAGVYVPAWDALGVLGKLEVASLGGGTGISFVAFPATANSPGAVGQFAWQAPYLAIYNGVQWVYLTAATVSPI